MPLRFLRSAAPCEKPTNDSFLLVGIFHVIIFMPLSCATPHVYGCAG